MYWGLGKMMRSVLSLVRLTICRNDAVVSSLRILIRPISLLLSICILCGVRTFSRCGSVSISSVIHSLCLGNKTITFWGDLDIDLPLSSLAVTRDPVSEIL